MANIADHSPFSRRFVRRRCVRRRLRRRVVVRFGLQCGSGAGFGGSGPDKEKGRRVAPTASWLLPGSDCYGWDTSGRRDRPCLSAVVPSEIGDHGAKTGETEHDWKARTRAFPAMASAWVAYMRLFMLLVPSRASNIRAFIRP